MNSSELRRAAPNPQGLCKCHALPLRQGRGSGLGMRDPLVGFANCKDLEFLQYESCHFVPGGSVKLPKLPQSRERKNKMEHTEKE